MELNKENVKKIILILFAAVAFCIGLINLSSVWAAVIKIIGILSPVILGLCIAFLLDPLTTFFETKLFGFIPRKVKKFGKAFARILGLILTLLIVAGAIAVLVLLVVPEVREAFSVIGETLPRAIANGINNINSFLERLDIEFRIPVGVSTEWTELFASAKTYIQSAFDNGIFSDIQSVLQKGIFSDIANTAMTVVSGFTDFILGLIFSLYVLAQREQILRFAGRFIKAYFRPTAVERIFKVSKITNLSFRNFVTGQLTEAVIIGLLCFVGMVVFRFPYPTATSAVVGVTALIPVFGAWIGGILGALLCLSVSFSKALLFIVFLIVLQQLEGDFIYPRVVGKSVGLPGILVFLSVMLGASIWGVLGMLLAVPLCSVGYTLVKESIDKRLRARDGSEADELSET